MTKDRGLRWERELSDGHGYPEAGGERATALWERGDEHSASAAAAVAALMVAAYEAP